MRDRLDGKRGIQEVARCKTVFLLLAEDAVSSEPVYGQNSPLAGKNTGNFGPLGNANTLTSANLETLRALYHNQLQNIGRLIELTSTVLSGYFAASMLPMSSLKTASLCRPSTLEAFRKKTGLPSTPRRCASCTSASIFGRYLPESSSF